MTTTRPIVILVVIAAMGLAAGCATRVRDADSAAGFPALLAAAPTVGVTGVTVDPTVDGIFTEDDQAAADDALYGALLAAKAGLDVWHPGTVRELDGDEALAALAADYANLGRLRPDHLRPLAAPLAGCRFLAFGRLTEESVRTHAQDQTISDPAARAEGQAEHGDPWAAIASVERRVTVTLEIFDLVSGDSVWRAEATSRKKQLYEYDDGSVIDPNAYLEKRLATVDEPVYLSRHGDALKLPDLVALMREAFTKLAEEIPAARS